MSGEPSKAGEPPQSKPEERSCSSSAGKPPSAEIIEMKHIGIAIPSKPKKSEMSELMKELEKPLTTRAGSSVTVDHVIDSVAHGKSLHEGPSWRKVRPSPGMDPSLKYAQQQLALEKKQPIRQQAPNSLPQPQQYRVNLTNPRPQQHQQPSTSGVSVKPTPPKPGTNMRPVQILAAPRGLLPVPPGIVQTASPDDHKFKKPLLPAKHRKAVPIVVDEEKRRREALEDAQRVQRHLQEAKRASQEAAQAKIIKQSGNRSAPKAVQLPTLPPAEEITEEMKKQSDTEKQQVCFNQELLEVPNILLHSHFILRQVCSKRTFFMLSAESREHLMKFLPAGAERDLERFLDAAFTTDFRMVHGNPMTTLHKRLKVGHFNADKINELIQIRDTEKILYDHYIRMYHMRLFKKLVISRHLLLQQYDTVHYEKVKRPGPQPIAPDIIAEKRRLSALKRRAAKRSRMMVSDCRQKVGEQGLSSDDENEDVGEPIHKALQNTTYQRSTLYNPRMKDLDMWQPLKVDDVKTMLKKYKRFKRNHPKAASLNLKGIELEHVFDRAGVLAQSQKIKETVAVLEKNLQRQNDPTGRLLFR